MPQPSTFEQKVMAALRFTDYYPDEFKSWIPRQLADNYAFSVSRFQITNVDGEKWHKVGDPGQPAFANSWTNLGGLYAPAGFYRTYTDIVRLRGVVKSGTIGSTIFILSPGYRPEYTYGFVVDSNGAHGRVEVDTSGAVKCIVGNNAFVFLDGITFRAYT